MQTVRTLEKMVKNITSNIYHKLVSYWGESYTTFIGCCLFGLIGGMISAIFFGWGAFVIGTGAAHLLLSAAVLSFRLFKWLHKEYVGAAGEVFEEEERREEPKLLENLED